MPETAAKPSKRATAAPKPKAKAKGAAAQENVSKAPKTGRPSKYTPELVAEICERISTGEPLRQICRDEHMPHWTQVYEWLSRDEGLSLRVTRAREAGYDALAEEALEIADTPRLGAKKVFSSGADEGEDSTTVTEEDMLGHRKLQIETRLKLLACWNPAKYGNKVALGGDPKNPLKVEIQVEADAYLATVLKNIELTKQVDANE
jgi:type III secretion system FlhB-like substrate exporter